MYGQPVQQVPANFRKTTVTNSGEAWWPFWTWQQRAAIGMPLPDVIKLNDDPTSPFDRHWRCIEGTQALWEVWCFRAGGFPFGDWGCSDWVRWDLTKAWNAPGQPLGVVAAKVPSVPFLLRWEEIQAKKITHALGLGLPAYAPEKVGPARGTDGRIAGHPLRAGEWLRLKGAVVDRIVTRDGIDHPRAIVAMALGKLGCYLCDTTTNVGSFGQTQDSRWVNGEPERGIPALGDLGLRLSDFEVIAQ